MTLLGFLLNVPDVQQSLFPVWDQNSIIPQLFASSRNCLAYSFLLVLSNCSLPNLLKSHSKYAELSIQLKTQRDPVQISRALFLGMSFSWILCPTNSSQCNPWTLICFLHLTEPSTLCLEPVSMYYNPESFSRQKIRDISGLSPCFPSLSDQNLTLPVV